MKIIVLILLIIAIIFMVNIILYLKNNPSAGRSLTSFDLGPKMPTLSLYNYNKRYFASLWGRYSHASSTAKTAKEPLASAKTTKTSTPQTNTASNPPAGNYSNLTVPTTISPQPVYYTSSYNYNYTQNTGGGLSGAPN